MTMFADIARTSPARRRTVGDPTLFARRGCEGVNHPRDRARPMHDL
jgi:hypothetical protein